MSKNISTSLGTTIAICTVIASILTAYFAANAAASDKLAGVAQDVAVLKDARRSTEDAIKDLSTKTDRIPYIEGKIDAALDSLKVNPQQIERNIRRTLLASTTNI